MEAIWMGLLGMAAALGLWFGGCAYGGRPRRGAADRPAQKEGHRDPAAGERQEEIDWRQLYDFLRYDGSEPMPMTAESEPTRGNKEESR